MDDLLADFVAESRDMLRALEGEVVAWEADPSDRARLDAIFRFVHTVKGNCGFFDLPRLQQLSHHAEDALADVRAGKRAADAALVGAVLAILDRIAAMVEAIDAGEDFPEGGDEQLIAALDAPAVPPANQDLSPNAAGQFAQRSAASMRTVRLPVELIDRVMSGVSDMVLARNDLSRRLQTSYSDAGLDAPFNRLSALLNDLRDTITRARMQPMELVFAGLPRMIRDLSAELGKQVMVDLEGGDVEIDREMIEIVRDPLMHLIRNAVDHGIEKPADRLAAGKREIGTLTISARQTGNEIRIGVIDDGRGIDGDKLVQKAIADGLLSEEQAATMDARARNLLICQPGLSTAHRVTEISGRGVGMDVVRANIEKIGGSLMIDSTPGSGTRIMLNVPLTLSIVPSLTVEVAGQTFAIPRSYVDEIVGSTAAGSDRDKAHKAGRIGGTRFLELRGVRVPCVGLGRVMKIAGAAKPEEQTIVVIRLVGGDRFGLGVDRVKNHEDLVIKPIAPVLMRTGFYVGMTQLDDGSPILALDVSGVAREAKMIPEVQDHKRINLAKETAAAEEVRIPFLLVDGFDGVRRLVPMSAVGRVERGPLASIHLSGDDHGTIAIGGVMLPLTSLGPIPRDREALDMLRVSDGSRELVLAIARVLDIVDLTGSQIGRSGNFLVEVDGTPIERIDCHALLAEVGEERVLADAPMCRLPTGDRWSENFLRPLVEAAGYRVADEDDSFVDLQFVLSGAPGDHDPSSSARQVLLVQKREDALAREDAIYRYDRQALTRALDGGRMGGVA